jgi:hypothetical protein
MMTRPADEALKEERKKKRMARLDDCVKSQHFVDWAVQQREGNPGTVVAMNPMW